MGDEPTLVDELDETTRFLRRLDAKASELSGRRAEVQERYDAAVQAAAMCGENAEVLEQVTTLIQNLEATWNKAFQKSIAKVISRGLTLVFETPTELRITTKVRADVSTVDFTIVTGEGEDAVEMPIVGAKGGTVIALVNVLVRALLIMSARPALRRLMLLDEPFGLADDLYIPAFGHLLREMCDRLGFQMIVVSHEEALVDMADYAYEAFDRNKRKHPFPNTSFRLIHSRKEDVA